MRTATPSNTSMRVITRRTRRVRVALENLEDRTTPSGLSFNFMLDDPGHQLDAYPALVPTLQAAGQVLSGLLDGQGPIDVSVSPLSISPEGAASASPQLVATGITPQGQTILEPAALIAARNGYNPLGAQPEIAMTIDPSSLANEWFDPSGAARTDPVPAGMHDFLSIALHELVHGLGFVYYNSAGGPAASLPAGTSLSSFAVNTALGAGGNSNVLYFTGAQAEAHYGGPVPLYSAPASSPFAASNNSHVGNTPGLPGEDIADLMNAQQFDDVRYPVSDLDLAMLADIGWSVLRYPGDPTPPVGPKVLNVDLVAKGGGLSEIVLTFNRTIDANSAQNLANYALALPRRVRHAGIVYNRPVRLASATLDATGNTVTLRLSRPICALQKAELTVTNVRDIYGHVLNGGSATPTGNPYRALVRLTRHARRAAAAARPMAH